MNRCSQNQLNKDLDSISHRIYSQTCRTHYDMPGFSLWNVGKELEPEAFRRMMIKLKDKLSEIHISVRGEECVFHSLMRFDQQVSTKLHLDGGPEESCLILGYEPSEVESDIYIADYSWASSEMGLDPQQFLKLYPPASEVTKTLLEKYTTRLTTFSNNEYQILCVNNSSTANNTSKTQWQGVLHQALITYPDQSKSRIINSTMITPLKKGMSYTLSKNHEEQFIYGE